MTPVENVDAMAVIVPPAIGLLATWAAICTGLRALAFWTGSQNTGPVDE